jgi:ABC-type multidrug transport system fused ATPase/permease subunit
MILTLRQLMSILSPSLRTAFKRCLAHTVISALIDATAFVTLYPLLTEIVSPKKTSTRSISDLLKTVFGNQPRNHIELYLAGITISLFILSTIVGVLLVRRQCKLVALIEEEVSDRMFLEYLSAPYLDHVSQNTSVFVRNTNILPTSLATNVSLAYFSLSQAIFSIGFLVVLLAAVNPLVILCTCVYFSVGFYLYARYVLPRAREAGKEGLLLNRLIIKCVQEGYGGIKAFQASNSTDVIEREFARRRREFAGVRYRISVYSQMPSYYLQAVMIGGVILFITIVLATDDRNITALVGIIVASFLRLLPNLYQALSSLGTIRSNQANIETLHGELQRLYGNRLEASPIPPPAPTEEEAALADAPVEVQEAEEEVRPVYEQRGAIGQAFIWTPEDEARAFIHERRAAARAAALADAGRPPQREPLRGNAEVFLGLEQLEAKRKRMSASNDTTPLQWDRSLRFDHVVFRYPGSEEIALNDVSFEIPKGSFVGIVGPSGAGKTTIVDLMLGLFPPTDGQIRIDEHELNDPAVVNAWRRSVGYVPQDVFLTDSSVRENVRFGASRVGGDDEIWEALASAQIAEFVDRLPKKLDTLLGERGVRISGGQRQRLGIARALYRKPAFLILDEATSSLDIATEAALAITVRDLEVENLTRVAVAHRLSTIRECDSLFLLEQGSLVGSGDFDSLRRENSFFDHLARLARID